jgi:hypothetical protein
VNFKPPSKFTGDLPVNFSAPFILTHDLPVNFRTPSKSTHYSTWILMAELVGESERGMLTALQKFWTVVAPEINHPPGG